MTDCHNEAQLQAWLDRELSPSASEAFLSHLNVCDRCRAHVRDAEEAFALIGAACRSHSEEPIPTARLRARIDDALVARAGAGRFGNDRSWWRWGIAAAAVLAIGILGPLVRRPEPPVPAATVPRTDSIAFVPGTVTPPQPDPAPEVVTAAPRPELVAVPPPPREDDAPGRARRATWLESQTIRHLERAQLVLRSVRNTQAVNASELEYERSLSRELVIRNRLLRRRAERQEDASAAEVLVQVEPFLVDIANLPDHAAAGEIVALQSLIRRQAIIAELRLYASMNGA